MEANSGQADVVELRHRERWGCLLEMRGPGLKSEVMERWGGARGERWGVVGCLPATSMRWRNACWPPAGPVPNARSQEEVCSLGGGHPQTESNYF